MKAYRKIRRETYYSKYSKKGFQVTDKEAGEKAYSTIKKYPEVSNTAFGKSSLCVGGVAGAPDGLGGKHRALRVRV